MRQGSSTSVQLRNGKSHPFSVMQNYIPLKNSEIRMYRAIREAIPVVDAAIIKLIRLTGGFKAECEDKTVQYDLNDFLRNVDTGRGQRGINSFMDCYLDSLITCGRAVGEIVLGHDRNIAAVLCGNVEDVLIREGNSPLEFDICAADKYGQMKPLPYQQLLLFSPFNPETDNPYGVSLLRSMPFLADILMKIYHCIGTNWERAGNVRFSVVYKPKDDIVDRAMAQERGRQIAGEWAKAMRENTDGSVCDFVSVGDVDIKVIGADNQVLDSEVPVRQIVEQLISRTGIPPFMLGLNWSSTERMSSQQADIMTSELTAIRRTLTPVVEKICGMWMRQRGYDCGFEIVWDDINLQDEVEDAHAQLYLAQAESVRNGGKGGENADENK